MTAVVVVEVQVVLGGAGMGMGLGVTGEGRGWAAMCNSAASGQTARQPAGRWSRRAEREKVRNDTVRTA
jgi:hypothetical protein